MWYVLIVFGIAFVPITSEVVKARYQQPIERSNEHRIKKNVLRHYDKTTRPVRSDKTQVQVVVAISLYHILDTNEKEQTFTSLIAVRQRWKDEYLVWNASEYGGIDTIRVPANTIWTPDLVISNFAGDKFNDYMVTNAIVSSNGGVLWMFPATTWSALDVSGDYMVTNAIVSSNGGVLWMFPALIKTYCTLNVKYFPFDTQNCEIVFISWTHSGNELDVNNSTNFENVVYYKSENQEWMVDGITTQQHVRQYACCPEPYPDVTFTINMRRGSLFYVVNLIAPCFLIFLISFLGFFLPVESGDKVNLETTILLALVVFLLMVGETMPPTPDAIPILGMFFASTMVMVTVALVMAVIVTNIYAKKESPERCPQWCIRLAMRFYPSVHIPERPDPLRTPQQLMGSCPTPPTMRTVDAGFYRTGSSGGERTKRKRKYAGCSGMSVVSTVADVIVAADPYTMHCCPESMSAGGAAFPDESSSSTLSSPSCGCFSPPHTGPSTGPSSELPKDVKGVHQSTPSVPPEAPSQPSRRFHNHPTIGGGGGGGVGGARVAGRGGGEGGRSAQRQTPPPPPATSSTAATTDPAFDYATSEAEWRMVAKFTDRVFFWIFLALSTVTHCSLFMQMSPETRQLLS